MGAAPAEERCVICDAAMAPAFRATVLGRHDVAYFHCPQCRHLRTQAPFWLDEAYSAAIARADTGIVQRNLELARRLTVLLDGLFGGGGRFLDTAGGTGLLVRLMRDAGFDFAWEDAHCGNALAAGFEARADEAGFDAVTAIEVLEHLTDPLGALRALLARTRTGTVIFTTELTAGAPPPPDWWYYAFPTGQHISFFAHETLAQLAERLDARLLSCRGLHMLTRQAVSEGQYRKWSDRARPGLLDKLRRPLAERIARRRGSLTQADHAAMLARGD